MWDQGIPFFSNLSQISTFPKILPCQLPLSMNPVKRSQQPGKAFAPMVMTELR
jgi:hypothetical protein